MGKEAPNFSSLKKIVTVFGYFLFPKLYQVSKKKSDFPKKYKIIQFIPINFQSVPKNCIILSKFTVFLVLQDTCIFKRDFFEQLVGDTIKLREEKNIVRPDMINLLLV